jgi:hypothetical protein
VAGSVSACGIGVTVPSLVSLSHEADRGTRLPLVKPRGVKGAAFTAWDDIAELLPGTERVAGVNAGESTLRVFFADLLDGLLARVPICGGARFGDRFVMKSLQPGLERSIGLSGEVERPSSSC